MYFDNKRFLSLDPNSKTETTNKTTRVQSTTSSKHEHLHTHTYITS